MILFRPMLCWYHQTSRQILNRTNVVHSLKRTFIPHRELRVNYTTVLYSDALKNGCAQHCSTSLCRSNRFVSTCMSHRYAPFIKKSSRSAQVQLSQCFSSSPWQCDANSDNGHKAKGSSLSETIDAETLDEGRVASEQRQASVRTLLDSAKSDKKVPDEFDFGDEVSEERTRLPKKPRIDPAETSVLLFPGQGSQFVGMAKDLLKYPNVEEMFTVASEILGYNLLSLCLNGPAEELNRTIHCQPAVVVTSLAAVEKLKEEQPKAIENCVAAAGFSVGEFGALVFGGSLSFQDAIYLIKVRAEAMQQASEMVSSGMMTVIGGKKARYKYVCKEAETYCKNLHKMSNPVCRVANYLYPDCRVIAGHTKALSFIKESSKMFYLRSLKPIAVSGAFHTPLMSSAQQPVSRALDAVTVETPVICVHSNVDGKAYGSADHIRRQLKKQIVQPVMWEQTMHCIYEREKGTPFPFTYEVGPGNQLGAMLKRNNLKAFHSYKNVQV